MFIRDGIVIAVVIVLSVIGLRRPHVGLCAYVGLSLLGPHSLAWSFARSLPHAQILAMATVLGYALSSEKTRMSWAREAGLLVALWVLFGLSTFTALEPDDALERLLLVSKIWLMAFFTLAIVGSEQRIHLLLRVIGLSLGFHAVRAALFVLRTGGGSLVQGPADTFLYANNSIGLALVMNVPILFYLRRIEPNRYLKWLMTAMLVASYPAVAGTFSRGSWIALAVVTMFMVVRGRRMAAGIGLLLAVVLIGYTLLPDLASDQMRARYGTLTEYNQDQSAQSRLWSWTFCSRVGMALPVTGAGFSFYSLGAYARFYPEFLERWPGEQWSCHSMWLSVLAEHGVVAFGLWVALLIACFLTLRRIRLAARTDSARLRHGAEWSRMLEGALIGYIVAGTFLDFAYFELYYELVAIIIVLGCLEMRRRVEARVGAPVAKPVTGLRLR
jgi:putative inorganic carbon (hco3(-)) transporter